MPTRLFLGLSALVWLPYGLYCFAAPSYLAEAAGVAATSATGTVELRAMYGGLQAALGALLAAALVRPGLRFAALVMVAFATSGLFAARLLGVFLDGGLSGYTGFALVFEAVSAGLAGWLATRE